MANRRNAQADQIISGKFQQYFGIDIVLEERSRKLLEPQAAQPIGDLGRHRQGSRSGAEASPLRRCRPSVLITEALPVVEDSLENTMWTPITRQQYSAQRML